MRISIASRAVLFSAALLLLCGAPVRADLAYWVTLDTTPLVGGATGPYSIEFQFNGVLNNTALINDFTFGGGSAGAAFGQVGTVTGDLASGIEMKTGTTFFNEFFQEFLPGNSLRFLVSLTDNYTAPEVPDQFSFAILNSSGFEIPTLGPASELLSVDLIDPLVINTYGGVDNGVDPVLSSPAVAAVPEPSAISLLAAAIFGAAALARKRGSSRS